MSFKKPRQDVGSRGTATAIGRLAFGVSFLFGCGMDQRPEGEGPAHFRPASEAPAIPIALGGGASGNQPPNDNAPTNLGPTDAIGGGSGGRRLLPDEPDVPDEPAPYADKTLATEPHLLVAFIGDQGNNSDSDAVLALIRAEGAVATFHNGDFDYVNNPEAWVERIDRNLGANYPYFAIVGNHDAPSWSGAGGYAEKIRQRHGRIPEMICEGEVGVRAECNFRGLHIIQSCIGVNELRVECQADQADQVDFIDDALRRSNAIWSICAWHKNQHDMQVGGKSNEVGWKAYQVCMRGGGLVITGHEHSYSRTLSLTDIGNEANGHGKGGAFDIMNLALGSTFVVVSGLAGREIRSYIPSSHDDDTWWASYFAADAWVKNGQSLEPSPAFGALFIEFNIGGDPRRARGYFKTTAGRVIDEFIISRN